MARAASPRNEIATQAPAGLPAELMDHMAADAGMGVSTSSAEVGIPFLSILQDLSPQVKRRDDAYIEGAEVGDIYNNLTKEVVKASVGIEFINTGFEAAQVEWRPDRGGFAGKHPHDTPLLAQVKMVEVAGKMVPKIDNGNLLTETKYYYGFYRARGSSDIWQQAIIGMSSSMIKCSREWQGILRRTVHPTTGVALPSFARVYLLGSSLVKKNNNEWFIWSIAQDRWVTSEEYAIARAMALEVLAGAVKTSAPDAGEGDAATRGHDEEVL